MARVLMIAPHPVYSGRGTPISVYNRAATLGALGHRVDLVTYPVGDDRPAEGLTYRRAPRLGLRVAEVPIGWSPAKVVYNVAMAGAALRLGVAGRSSFAVVHSHEEGALVGVPLARLLRVPHVYDMGNGWGTVVENTSDGGPRSRLVGAANRMEAAVVGRSDAVIAQVPGVRDRLVRAGFGDRVTLVANVPLDAPGDPARAAELRASLSMADGACLFAYTGTLERYQGIDMLVQAVAAARQFPTNAHVVVVGGRQPQVEALRALAGELGVADSITFTGSLPGEEVTAWQLAADVLVSPRAAGDNAPFKVLGYLRAGRALLVTDIVSHTSMLDASAAEFVAPTAAGLAAGLDRLAVDPPRRSRLAAGAAALGTAHSPEAFVDLHDAVYRRIGLVAPTAPARAPQPTTEVVAS